MSKDIATLLKEATKGLLSDESLAAIKETFDTAVTDRASVHVEKALAEQDAEYTSKLEHLLEAIDTDHTRKLHRVVEAIDHNNTAKLQSVVRKYSAALTEQAGSFKNDLVTQISDYLDVYLEKTLPQNTINEAVRDKKARIVLDNLRKSLAVDSALMAESIRDAVIDGKKQISEASSEVAKLREANAELTDKVTKLQANVVFEQKTAGLTDQKKAYARRVLEGKSAQFIIENIDYTLSLFDKKEEERLDVLREEALESRVIREHVVVEEGTESDNSAESLQQNEISTPYLTNYLSELGKY